MSNDSEPEKTYSDSVEELYLALEKVLEKLSQSSKPQRKLASELSTLLQHHYEVYGYLQDKPSGDVEIELRKD